MGAITKGEITLMNVNDAYSVSLTNASCVVNANFDGSNVNLDNAHTVVSIAKGGKSVPFACKLLTDGHVGFTSSITPSTMEDYALQWSIVITALTNTNLSDYTEYELITEDGYVTTIRFSYTLIREASMLDWIQDWDSNKTKIGDDSIITPRLFVGKKIESGVYGSLSTVDELTGVYIGPNGSESAGIYGYQNNKEIFRIDETGGLIGGWTISADGIVSSGGNLQILSSGQIICLPTDGASAAWSISEVGTAIFASGNVEFYADGSASFAGTITSEAGLIGGWNIMPGALWSGGIALVAGTSQGYNPHISVTPYAWNQLYDETAKTVGGIEIFYNNQNSFGIIGYLPMTNTVDDVVRIAFSLGDTNVIAGWNFDDTAIWRGTKLDSTQAVTTESGSVTIGSNGLRGYKWYIDANGDVSFMGGLIKFTAADDGGEIVGWKLTSKRLSTDNVALVSDGSVTGLYMSVATDEEGNSITRFNSRSSAALEDFIDSYGGIYMNINSTGAEFAAYNQDGKKLFKLKSDDVCSIAGWNFDRLDLYTGDTKTTAGFTEWPYITLGTAGLRGPQWRLENTGGGAIAGGAISWTDEGEITFTEAVSLLWSSGIDAAQNSANAAQDSADNAANAANEADKLARKLSLVSQQMAYGKMLFRDPEFEGTDKNSAKIYPFGNTGGTLELVQYSTAPNNSQRVLKMQSTQWHAADDHRLTGFYFANRSRANAKFAVRIVANIPVGWKIQNYHNAFGTGGFGEWLTSQAGTGTWEEYIYLVTCGAEGEFSTVNHFALILNTELGFVDSTIAGSTSITFAKDGVEILAPAVTWMVAYATVIDLSSSDKLTTCIDINGIYTGTLRADQIISGTITTANIMQHEGSWELNQDGSGHLANGNVSWDTSGNVSLNGKIIATEGTIGGFEIGENFIKTEGTGSLQIGDSNFNAIFAVTSETKQVTLNLGINSIYIGSETFNYKTNNQITIKNTGSGSYDWLNIAIANVMNIDYFKSDSPTTSPINRYGYQFAMLGTGHVIMDAIVEGACCDTIHQFTANYQLEWVKPPMYGNRILINSGNYTNCGIVLPDKYSVFSTLGCGVITNTTAKPFTFRLDLINTGNNTIYFAGRGTVTIGSFNTNNEALPYIYDAGGTHRSWDSNNPPTYLKSKQMVSILLVYDGTNYMAFLINKDF